LKSAAKSTGAQIVGTARAALSLRFIEVAASAQRLPKPSFLVIALTRPESAADILFAHEINENHETFRQ
jgi:hypothetical protein